MRSEYTREDFPSGLERGKYLDRLDQPGNVVVLRPEVAAVFPTGKAVNDALMSLIEVANKTAGKR